MSTDKQQPDVDEDIQTLTEIWREHRETVDEINETLLDFVENHPVFSKEVGLHDDSTGNVESRILAKATPRRGEDRPMSEWEAAAAWGYKEALLDFLSEVDGHTEIPRREDET